VHSLKHFASASVLATGAASAMAKPALSCHSKRNMK